MWTKPLKKEKISRQAQLQLQRKPPRRKITSQKKQKNKHNAELQRVDPGTKDMGKFSTKILKNYLPWIMEVLEMKFTYFHRNCRKILSKMIGHMPCIKKIVKKGLVLIYSVFFPQIT